MPSASLCCQSLKRKVAVEGTESNIGQERRTCCETNNMNIVYSEFTSKQTMLQMSMPKLKSCSLRVVQHRQRHGFQCHTALWGHLSVAKDHSFQFH